MRIPALLGHLAALLLASACAAPPATPAPQRPPNVIFLLTDDHRADALGAAGNPIIQTPELDALARDGVRFRNAFVTTPICMTSRASVLTGEYARLHGIDDFATELSPAQLAGSYPVLLRSAGYWSGFIGKYGVGNEMPTDAFDVWHGFPGQGKYETTDAEGHPIHLTRLMGRQAVQFIRDAPAGRPFTLSVSFKAPHVQDEDARQFIPDPLEGGLYRDVTIPLAPTATDRHLAALPSFIRVDTTESRLRWYKRFATPAMYQESVKNYYRLITGVDVVVGQIREALRQRGEADNTIIVFTGDNGFFLGEHGLAGKWYGYQESVRVPLIVHDPRLPAAARGQVRDEIALNVDLAPTLLDAAGLPVPGRMQGRTLMPLVRGRDAANWRGDFLFEHPFRHTRIPRSEGVVGGRYTYLRYLDGSPGFEQLFDLERDPHETTNLAPDPAHAEVLGRMRARHAELVAAASRPGPVRP